MIIAPRLDADMLTRAHVVLCRIKAKERRDGNTGDADVLSYVDFLVLTLRNLAVRREAAQP